MVNGSVISELIINILRVLLIRKMTGVLLPAEEEEGKAAGFGFVCYYLLTAVLHCMCGISMLYGILNYLGIAALTYFYQGTWKKRIWVSLAVFATDLACHLAVYFAFPQGFAVNQQAVQALLLLICVTVISRTAYPADSREIAFDRRQTCILIAVPAAGVLILSILLYGGYEGLAATVICLSTIMINLAVFCLYHMMAGNYRRLRETDLYRQQTYAYQNQLEVIMESQGRIRALRHDMKNHILALQMLLQKQDWEEAGRYLNAMQDFMANPSEYSMTGNESVDSLLNYKLQRADEVLNTVEAKIIIPEKLMLHSFDLNVVLGNLLDNAIEAAVQTEEKKLGIKMKLEKGILFLNIRNSCQGIADGTVRRPETTKRDASVHGIGLSNVQRMIEKYHGEMDLSCEDGCMEADIMMYIEEM